jgi:hypothetical protein
MADYNVESLTKAYTQLRDSRAELKKTYEEADFKLKAKMEKLEVRLLEKLGEFQVDSVKTPYGTVYTQIERKFQCADWSSFWNWMRENDRLDCVEKRVSQGAMRELENEGIELPPAISSSSERVVRVQTNMIYSEALMKKWYPQISGDKDMRKQTKAKKVTKRVRAKTVFAVGPQEPKCAAGQPCDDKIVGPETNFCSPQVWFDKPQRPGLHLMRSIRGSNVDYHAVVATLIDDGSTNSHFLFKHANGDGYGINIKDWTRPQFFQIKE